MVYISSLCVLWFLYPETKFSTPHIWLELMHPDCVFRSIAYAQKTYRSQAYSTQSHIHFLNPGTNCKGNDRLERKPAHEWDRLKAETRRLSFSLGEGQG